MRFQHQPRAEEPPDVSDTRVNVHIASTKDPPLKTMTVSTVPHLPPLCPPTARDCGGGGGAAAAMPVQQNAPPRRSGDSEKTSTAKGPRRARMPTPLPLIKSLITAGDSTPTPLTRHGGRSPGSLNLNDLSASSEEDDPPCIVLRDGSCPCSLTGDFSTPIKSKSPHSPVEIALSPYTLQTSNASTELKCWRKGFLIGRGTYGSVFLGLLKDGSFCTVICTGLVYDRDGNVNQQDLNNIREGIERVKELTHRNLCSFKGVLFDAEATSICMFMEYVGGDSLTSIVKRFKPLPAPVVRRWTRQLLTGLLYLHSQHIIHRDIKGDNVLIDTNASPDSEAQVKLVDFGAARRLTDAVSQSRTVIGTPYWMAPEVVDMAGEGKGYSYKADVWSVGCTVAEMLTGRPPWPARENAPAAIIMVATASGMPTEVPQAEATPGCYDFMVKCFERDPDKRPTVEELLQHPWILGEME